VALTVSHIAVDCENALLLARFWSAALGIPLRAGGDEDYASLDATTGGSGWLFFRVPEPKTAKNRMHVDLSSPHRDTEVTRLVDLGATIVDEHFERETRWTVLQDPEGNEFCVTQG
jgi:predicted enzyme related to lactoylglutathione lyase